MRITEALVGFIGLGNMGRPIAERLLHAGYRLVVHDIATQNADPLKNFGAGWADSPRAVAENCQVICTSLPGPEQAKQVFYGNDGILGGVQPQALCIDFTTNSPLLVRKLHGELLERESQLLDVPLSGGVEGAKNGTLTLLASGNEKSFLQAEPLLQVLGENILYLGEIGVASVCKVLHNCAVFCSNLATVECLTAGIKAGVEPSMIIEVFQKSGLGRNLDLQLAMPKTLFQGNFAPRFAMSTACKDMGLATELARAYAVPMQMAELCEKEMQTAVSRGWGSKDNTVFLTLQEERAGVEIRIDGSTKAGETLDD